MLEAKNLKKIFRMDSNPENDRLALDDVSLTLNDGDFVSVIGSNGSGKTTLLNLIAGVHFPDSGSILLNGKDITRLPVHRRAKHVARVFQDPMMGTIADISLFENLSIASRRGKKQSPFRFALTKSSKARFQEILAPLGLGLEERMEAPMGTFSGGQRQSVTLLMATLMRPDILLLDEHTAALDPNTAKKVMELTSKIVEESHIPTLMITHNMKDAIKYGNRLIMMSKGKIVLDVSGEEKKKLTVPMLIERFEDADLPDSAILG